MEEAENWGCEVNSRIFGFWDYKVDRWVYNDIQGKTQTHREEEHKHWLHQQTLKAQLKVSFPIPECTENHALTSVSLVASDWHMYISARRTSEVSENSDLWPVTLKETGTHRYTNRCMKRPSRPHGTYADKPSGVQTHTAICSHTWMWTDIIWIMTRRDM